MHDGLWWRSGDHRCRQSCRLPPEQERISRPVGDLAIPGLTNRLHQPKPGGLHHGEAAREIRVLLHAGHLVVVESGAPDLGRIEGKPERVDQMQLTTGIRCQSNHVAGIGWDFRFEQDDMEHGSESVVSKAIIPP